VDTGILIPTWTRQILNEEKMILKKEMEIWKNSNCVKSIFGVDKNGLKQGISESFYPNGSLWGRVQYKDNQLEGPFVRYYPNGKILEKGTYHKGWLNGVYQVYNQENILIKRIIYKNGWPEQGLIQKRSFER